MDNQRRRHSDLESTNPQPSAEHVVTREIPIKRRDTLVFIIGVEGSNIRRLKSLVGVTDVCVDNDRCVVHVKALTSQALDGVEKDINLLLDKMNLLSKLTYLKNTTGLKIRDNSDSTDHRFRSSRDCIFEVMRFCSLFGIDHKYYIQENNIISVDYVDDEKLEEILHFLEYWNANVVFLDVEEMWKRKRPIIQSNFTEKLLVSCNYVRSWSSYYKLNTLRCLPGVDYVEIDCGEEDVIMQLTMGAKSMMELNSGVLLARMYFNNYLASLKVHRFCADGIERSDYISCIPYACAADKLIRKDKFSRVSYLEKMIGEPEVILVKLDEKTQTLTLSCLSQARLNQLLFEVRGFMSLHKAFAWRKKYHASFWCHIKISDEQKQMDAVFQDFSENKNLYHIADFTDVVDHSCKSLRLIRLQGPLLNNKGVLNSDALLKSSYLQYCKSEMVAEFRRFLAFEDLPFLHNLTAFTRFGFTLYRMTMYKKWYSKSVCQLFNSWEEDFFGEFSFDLNSSFKAVFMKQLLSEDSKEISRQCFTKVFFNNLGNNLRFMARIDFTGPSLNQQVRLYNYCKTDHCHFRVIDIDSSKSSKQIIVSSQKPCDNILAKEFVEQCMSSGELLAEDVMSINSHYSMYNVSIVNRTVLQYKDFIIHLDSVSKKSNQRYGRFSDVVHLTLHHPRLNETIHQLQSNIGDDFLIKSAVLLYEELISASEHLSTIMDKFIS